MASSSKRPKRNTGPWSSGRILAASSPLTDKNVYNFLLDCISRWHTDYSEDEKRAIIDSLPAAYRHYDVDENNKLRCPVPTNLLNDNQYVKRSVFRFKSDVKDGFYDKSWQNLAQRAMQERKDGKFDQYVEEYAEELFGTETSDGLVDQA